MPTLVDALRSLDGRTVLIALFASVFTYIFVGGLINYRKLSQFKGPPVAAFSRIWLFKHSLSADVNRAQFEALARYGKSLSENIDQYVHRSLADQLILQVHHAVLVQICSSPTMQISSDI